eukprot:scaffold295844_cov21-Tisochrysis_lutea.AAC.1
MLRGAKLAMAPKVRSFVLGAASASLPGERQSAITCHSIQCAMSCCPEGLGLSQLCCHIGGVQGPTCQACLGCEELDNAIHKAYIYGIGQPYLWWDGLGCVEGCSLWAPGAAAPGKSGAESTSRARMGQLKLCFGTAYGRLGCNAQIVAQVGTRQCHRLQVGL